MWFRLGIQNFVAKNIIHDDSCELYISDFTRIWHKSLTNEELISISQRLNPLLEASVQKLKEMTSNLLKDEKAEKAITEENNNIILKLKSSSLGVKFLFQIVLHHENEDFFYKEFTLPLLLLFIKLQSREKKLLQIITDKDAEIKEYKQECGVIKSSYMATEPFDKEEFETQESVTNICDISSFLECINSLVPVVKKEESSSEDLSDKCFPDGNKKCITDTEHAIFRNVNREVEVDQCVKLEHKTIKRRKKQNNAFKIKF